MTRERLVEITARVVDHAVKGTVPLEPSVANVPAAHYYDHDRWRAEMDRIFGRVPLVAGFSAELAEPNSYVAVELAGVPILIVRTGDGDLAAFVNMCSHRGSVLAPEGAGSARRFTCPYHGWSYDQGGALVGVTDRAEFGDLDLDCMGLTALAVEERAGLVFVCSNPAGSLHLDAFLNGYGELLEHLGLADCTVVGRQSVDGPNWKVAYDGYVDFYHLPILHRNSFGPNIANKACFEAWGPHQRVMAPDARMAALASVDTDDWSHNKLTDGVWTIFPHVSIASFDAGGRLYMVSQLFPGANPDESVTVQTFLAMSPPDDERRPLIATQMAFLLDVVRDEDYATGLGIGRAARTGTRTDFVFGRNEGGGQRFHRWTDALIAADDDDLVTLYGKVI